MSISGILLVMYTSREKSDLNQYRQIKISLSEPVKLSSCDENMNTNTNSSFVTDIVSRVFEYIFCV